LQPNRIFLIIDSCFSGGGNKYQKTITASKFKDFGNKNTFTKGFAGQGRALISSSYDNEVSIESAQLQNGVFSFYLFDSIKKGRKELQEIYEYVYDNVRKYTKDNQHPRLDTIEQKGILYLLGLEN